MFLGWFCASGSGCFFWCAASTTMACFFSGQCLFLRAHQIPAGSPTVNQESNSHSLIGVKRNAERYKFWEPRLRVDPVWARSRRSRFCICNAQPDVNFLATFAKRVTFGSKITFWAYFSFFGPKSRFWGPKRTFDPKIDFGSKWRSFCLKFHWFYKHPRHGDAKTHFYPKLES